MVYIAMMLPPADFWVWREVAGEKLHMPTAFSAIFGQSLWIVAGSLTAFLIGAACRCGEFSLATATD